MYDFYLLTYFDPFMTNFVISDGFKIERKSSFLLTSHFFKSKITEAILEKITVRGIFQTRLHIEIHKLY